MTETDLLTMELHQQVKNDGYIIVRVMGGWIYCREEPQVNVASPVFVPYTETL